VADALTNNKWVTEIRGGLTWSVIREFLQLWDCVQDFELNEMEDRHVWRLESGGCYSSKSAYRAYFQGSITFEPWKKLGNLGLQISVKSFFGWPFAIGVGQLIVLKREGCLIPISALYVTKKMRQCSTC